MDTYASVAGKQIVGLSGGPGMEQTSSKHFSRSVLKTEQSNRLSFVQGGRMGGGFDQVGFGVGQAGFFQPHLFQLCTVGFSQQSGFPLPALPELQLSTDGFSQVGGFGFSQVGGFGFCQVGGFGFSQAGGFGFCQVGGFGFSQVGFSHEDDFELLLGDPPQLSHEDDFELPLVDPPQVTLGSLQSSDSRDSNPRLGPHFGFSHAEGFSQELLERPCEMKIYI